MIFPGKSFFSPKNPADVNISAPPPIPTREDPAIGAARERQRLSDKRRRGRAASILTGPEGTMDEPELARAGARLLGR